MYPLLYVQAKKYVAWTVSIFNSDCHTRSSCARGTKFSAQEKKIPAQGIEISCAQKIISCAGNRRTLRGKINFLRRDFYVRQFVFANFTSSSVF
jgi:hypothetical protein